LLFQQEKARKVFSKFKNSFLVHTSPASRKSKLKQNKNKQCLPTGKLQPVTESASSASAMSTGKWVPAGCIASSLKGRKFLSITEKVRNKSPNTKFGILCTTEFFDATPAAFYAHSKTRYDYQEISNQILNWGLDAIVTGGKFSDKILKKSVASQIPYIRSFHKTRTKNFRAKLVANELNSCLKNCLKKKKNDRFFLLAEESLIDVASHNEDIDKMACELNSFLYTVETALHFAQNLSNKTTLIVISDHSTGSPSVQNNKNNSASHFEFHSGIHNGHLVPMYVAGYRTEVVRKFAGSCFMEMPDVHRLLCKLLI
jgi:alkaline phosphatase